MICTSTIHGGRRAKAGARRALEACFQGRERLAAVLTDRTIPKALAALMGQALSVGPYPKHLLRLLPQCKAKASPTGRSQQLRSKPSSLTLQHYHSRHPKMDHSVRRDDGSSELAFVKSVRLKSHLQALVTPIPAGYANLIAAMIWPL